MARIKPAPMAKLFHFTLRWVYWRKQPRESANPYYQELKLLRKIYVVPRKFLEASIVSTHHPIFRLMESILYVIHKVNLRPQVAESVPEL